MEAAQQLAEYVKTNERELSYCPKRQAARHNARYGDVSTCTALLHYYRALGPLD